jgi:hypothetical protein
MSWMITVGAMLLVCFVGMLGLTEWVIRRGRASRGLQWCDNSPRKPHTIER